MKDEYLPVPGFPAYRVNTATGDVESCHTLFGRTPRGPATWRPLRRYNVMLIEGRRRVRRSQAYIAYCARAGIDPGEINHHLLTLRHADGRQELLTRQEFRRRLSTLETRDQQYVCTLEEAIAECRETAAFCREIERGYTTGDFSGVVLHIWQYEQQVKAYIQHALHIRNPYKRDAIWVAASDNMLRCIEERKAVICDPRAKLFRYARAMMKRLRRQCGYQRPYREGLPEHELASLNDYD